MAALLIISNICDQSRHHCLPAMPFHRQSLAAAHTWNQGSC